MVGGSGMGGGPEDLMNGAVVFTTVCQGVRCGGVGGWRGRGGGVRGEGEETSIVINLRDFFFFFFFFFSNIFSTHMVWA